MHSYWGVFVGFGFRGLGLAEGVRVEGFGFLGFGFGLGV